MLSLQDFGAKGKSGHLKMVAKCLLGVGKLQFFGRAYYSLFLRNRIKYLLYLVKKENNSQWAGKINNK